MMQHKISGGQSRAGDPGRPYCVASSCPGFCVHDIPLKLIRRFELFSYLIQFVTGCKPGSVFTNQQTASPSLNIKQRFLSVCISEHLGELNILPLNLHSARRTIYHTKCILSVLSFVCRRQAPSVLVVSRLTT